MQPHTVPHSPKNHPSTRARTSSLTQNLNPLTKRLLDDPPIISANKKNPKCKNTHLILQQIKIDPLKENSITKHYSVNKQTKNLILSNKDFLPSSPFNNLSNFKPHHLEPLSQNPTKTKLFHPELLQKFSPQNSPKLSQKQRQMCQKLYQQKLSQQTETKRKSISHRIHVTSSKEKENIFKKMNELKTVLQNQTNLNLISNESSQFPQIEAQMVPKLVSNRQQSCHSFMIRKKIVSTSKQGQKSQKKVQKIQNKYRKQKYSKEQKDDDRIPQDTQIVNDIEKIENDESKTCKKIKSHSYKIQAEDNQKTEKLSFHGKSLKMRKGKYSKIQQFIGQKNEAQINRYDILNIQSKSKFRSTIEDNLEFKNIHKIQSEDRDMKSQNKHQIEVVEQKNINAHNDSIKIFNGSEIYKISQIQSALINQPQNKITSHQETGHKQNQFAENQQFKAIRKRVSSIRALKNIYKNLHTEEQSQILTQSKINEQTKRRQKEPACLTHKIKWGTHTRKKSISQKGIQFTSNLNSQIWPDQKANQKELMFGILKEKYHMNTQFQESQLNTDKKETKKIRFLQDCLQSQIQQSPTKSSNSKAICKKESSQRFEKVSNNDISHEVGSRSLIVFDDPGISIIIRKDSCAQSSDFQHDSNHIEDGSSSFLGNDKNVEKHLRKRKQSDNVRLESLRQLFYELKSHHSIYVPEERQSINVSKFQEDKKQ